MSEPIKLVKIPSLKTIAEFRQHVASLGLDLPCDDLLVTGPDSPLLSPVDNVRINGKRIGNRIAVQPMEGWDGTAAGGITAEVRRRWQRFGESGSKLICGGEAMAVRADGRANPRQLIINEANRSELAELRQLLIQAHSERHGATDDLVIGFQLTHSGRFCKPNDSGRLEPRVAYRHPLLDSRFGVTEDKQVFTDGELGDLVADYVRAAQVAVEAGADFVDLKHCHGYLLHEFLSAYTRPGRYGGSFENRTRLLREIVAGIRASGNPIELGVRLSAFDMVPFKPAWVRGSQIGPGVPEQFEQCLPYQFAFGVDPANPLQPKLDEAFRFADLCRELGVKILNLTAGSPYYNPHIQRPAAYPPSDGYQPPEDPVVGVARQINAVKQIRDFLRSGPRQDPAAVPTNSPGSGRNSPDPGRDSSVLVVGSAYSYLQEFLPNVAQYVTREGWTDAVGIGRMVLSYPAMLLDSATGGAFDRKRICRTFSDCTTAPRNGLISGCYPLDEYYARKAEAQTVKAVKRRS